MGRGRKDNSKVRILAIERMLKPDQMITATEIMSRLEAEWDIVVDRKTVYDDLKAINLIVPIKSESGKNGGYMLTNVLVDAEPVFFICPYNKECRCQDAACSSCGWNPTVSKKRLECIRKTLKEKEVQNDV